MEGIDSSVPCLCEWLVPVTSRCLLSPEADHQAYDASKSLHLLFFWALGSWEDSSRQITQKHASSRPDKEDATVTLHPHCPVPLHLSAVLGGGCVLRTGSEAGTGGLLFIGRDMVQVPIS